MTVPATLPRLRGLALLALGALVAPSLSLAQPHVDPLERDLTIQQRPVYDVGQPARPTGGGGAQPGQPAIAFDAWVDRHERSYRIGDPITLSVRPAEDAFITVLNVGTSGRVAVLFPNFHQQDNRVRAGQTLTIPGPGAPYSLGVSGPVGIDTVKVIASSEPLRLPELQRMGELSVQRPFASEGRMADAVARDLEIQLPGASRPTPAAQASPQPAPAPAPQPVQAAGIRWGMRNLLIRVMEAQAAAAPVQPPQAQVQIPVAAAVPPAQPDAGFGLAIRADKPAYRVGEPIRLLVTVAQDCRLALVNVGPSGQARVLFPNAQQQDDAIRAGQSLQLPAPGSGVVLTAQGPGGVETVLGYCRPLSEPPMFPPTAAGAPAAPPAGAPATPASGGAATQEAGGPAFRILGSGSEYARDIAVQPAGATGGASRPTGPGRASLSYVIVD